ncbi:MAG TPA: RelA/SpoT family protein [Candidatus Saccharimonadales bacterium]
MDSQQLLELAQPHFDPAQIKRLAQAIDLAQAKHRGQKRLSGEDYLTHPLNVAAILIEWRLGIDTIIAGILHDTLEDTDTAPDEVKQAFGDDIAFLVDGVSKVSKARSGMSDISSYRPQTADNLSKLLIAISQDVRVLLIKLADRLHNLRTLEHLSTAKRTKIARESLSVFAPLADRLGMGRVKIEIEEIAFSYLSPKEYNRLQGLLKKRVGRAQKYLNRARREVSAELARQAINFSVDGRIKSIYSLHKKLQKSPIEETYDLMALRIIVDSNEDCYRVLGILHAMYQPMITKIKDYIAVPKPNGYQSLHTTVIVPAGQIVEFQIRTQSMHEYAERGLAASFHYNEQKLSKTYALRQSQTLPRNLRWILDLQETAQRLMEGEISPGNLEVDIFSDRIFVHSPKGDIYDLPEGSSVLDFAFAVHSDVGRHAFGARVNNKIAKLGTTLKNGDIIEVLTRSSIKPSKDWLKYVATAKARQKIRSFLNRQN